MGLGLPYSCSGCRGPSPQPRQGEIPVLPHQDLGLWARAAWEDREQAQWSAARCRSCPDCKGPGHTGTPAPTALQKALSSANHDCLLFFVCKNPDRVKLTHMLGRRQSGLETGLGISIPLATKPTKQGRGECHLCSPSPRSGPRAASPGLGTSLLGLHSSDT